MKTAVPFASLVGRRMSTTRWLAPATTTAAATPSFEYRQQSKDDPKLRKTCTTCGFVNYENPKVVCGSVLTIKGERSSSANRADDDEVAIRDEDLFVLGRRTIHPRRGFWGIPAGPRLGGRGAVNTLEEGIQILLDQEEGHTTVRRIEGQGFLEIGETGEEGAAREAREEMNAEIDVGGLLAVYCLPHIGQTQMIYSSVLRNRGEPGGSLPISNMSAGQETDELISVRWEDIPWDELAFPTTSWALWHQRLRNEAAAKSGNEFASSLPLATIEDVHELGRRRGAAAGKKKGVAEEIHAVGIGDASLPQADAADAPRVGLGLGLGVSEGTVFSTPSTNSSLFWCPDRGLHLKTDWNVSTDS